MNLDLHVTYLNGCKVGLESTVVTGRVLDFFLLIKISMTSYSI